MVTVSLCTQAHRKLYFFLPFRPLVVSRAMQADSWQTDLCAYLSAITLAALALNALFGWWWADPVTALVMLPITEKEGVEALRGETCCDDEMCH